jgi:putative oxidoreductase
MNMLHDAAALLGRILIAYLFVPAGWSKIGNFGGTSGYIASKGLPLPDVGAAIAVAVELVAGLMLLVGWKTRWAALLLAVFTLAASVFFHAYWAVPADQQMMQRLMFNKNVAIVGGLLLLYAFGPGRLAVERR